MTFLTLPLLVFSSTSTPVAAGRQEPLVCPVAGHEASADGPIYDYRGVRYRLCCDDCKPIFEKNPAEALKNPMLDGKVSGVFLFDPVSGAPVTKAKSRGSSDYKGVRFHFLSARNKTEFDADPKRYGTIPEKEAMFCPVLQVELRNYYGVNGFVDHAAVRYYACCAMCFGVMKANIAKFTPNASKHVAPPKALPVPPAIAKIAGF